MKYQRMSREITVGGDEIEGGFTPSIPTPFYSRLLDRYLKTT
jgi:hypothetical protein